MAKGKKGSKSKKKLFDVDTVKTQLVSAIHGDMAKWNTEYSTRPAALSYYAKIQRKDILKKYVDPTDTNRQHLGDEVLALFLQVNDHMGNFHRDYRVRKAPRCMRDNILSTARNVCHQILGDIGMDEWFNHCKNSGGVSQGVSFWNTSLEAKFHYPISVTERLKPLVSLYSQHDPLLMRSIAISNDTGSDREVDQYEISLASRATTVPKNDKIDRMIAIEPTWNMFFQQGLMRVFYTRLAAFGLDVSTLPDIHKKVAKEASITGHLSTIDFSSASDCISPTLVEALLPPSWFAKVDIVRSRYMKVSDQHVPLNMISTMGNAVTFPLELIVFYSLAVASMHFSSLKPGYIRSTLVDFTDPSVSSVSVFGDDCILPTVAVAPFAYICKEVGLLINQEKSCIGPAPGFRESCGGDYLHGDDVRPFYLKGPTSGSLSALEPWLYIVVNSILKKCMLHFGTLSYVYMLPRLMSVVRKLQVQYGFYLKIVPDSFPDDAGLKIGHDYARFSRTYHSLVFSRIGVDIHGQVEFQYCAFRYTSTELVDWDLRYSEHLKKTFLRYSISRDALPERYRTRRKGGYVVSKARSSFWSSVLSNTNYSAGI